MYPPAVKPLLLVRHEAADLLGLAIPTLEEERLDLHVQRAWDEAQPWPDLSEISGIVSFGGEVNVDRTDVLPSLAHERALVREAVERGLPILGICLGAQLLARAMDRPVFASATREFGFVPIRPTEAGAADPLLSVFSPGDHVFHWHEDTFELPPGAELLAAGEDVPVQAYRIRDLAWGIQFHFEIDTVELEEWLASEGEDLEEVWGKSAGQVRAEAREHLAAQERTGREVFRRFAGIVRQGG